jgi:hypothetical protein
LVKNVILVDDRCETMSQKISSSTKKFTENSIKELITKFDTLNNKRKLQGLSLLTLLLPLSACGGSKTSEEVVSLPEVSGRAIDGYLVGSRVSLSSDPDTFVETTAVDGQQGLFEGLFGTGSIVVTGGVDIATGKSFTGELRAPAPEVVTDEAGNQTVAELVVTPLTTLVEAVVSSAAATGSAPVSVAEASAQVAK